MITSILSFSLLSRKTLQMYSSGSDVTTPVQLAKVRVYEKYSIHQQRLKSYHKHKEHNCCINYPYIYYSKTFCYVVVRIKHISNSISAS